MVEVLAQARACVVSINYYIGGEIVAEKALGTMASLPIEALVAAPVMAAMRSQIMMSQEFANFIQTVGMDKEGNIRMVPFTFPAPVIGEDGLPTGKTKDCKVSAPFIALTGIPNFAIEELIVEFNMKVETMEQEESEFSPEQEKVGQGKASGLKINGRIAESTKQTRKTDTNSQYQFKITARKQEPPEAIMKIFDILTASTIKMIQTG